MKNSSNFPLSLGAGLLGFVSAACAQNLDTHPVRLDGTGKLLSWVTPQDKAYGHVAKLSADFIKAAMVGPIDPGNGLPAIYTHSEYHPVTYVGSGWPNHPAGRHLMLADSLALYYAYSGDTGALDAVRALLDYQLSANGTTPANYVWAKVPWSASSNTARTSSRRSASSTNASGSISATSPPIKPHAPLRGTG